MLIFPLITYNTLVLYSIAKKHEVSEGEEEGIQEVKDTSCAASTVFGHYCKGALCNNYWGGISGDLVKLSEAGRS